MHVAQNQASLFITFSSVPFHWQTLHACTLRILAELSTTNIHLLITLFHQHRLYGMEQCGNFKINSKEQDSSRGILKQSTLDTNNCLQEPNRKQNEPELEEPISRSRSEPWNFQETMQQWEVLKDDIPGKPYEHSNFNTYQPRYFRVNTEYWQRRKKYLKSPPTLFVRKTEKTPVYFSDVISVGKK